MKSNLSQRFVSLVLLLNLALPHWALADDIPDEINTQKYSAIYLAAKKISDAKRAQADDLLQTAKDLDTQKQQAQRDLDSKQNQVDRNLKSIERLELEIPALQAQNDALNQEIQRLRSDMNGNNLIISDLDRQITALNRQIQDGQESVRQIRIAYDQANNQYSEASLRLDRHVKELEGMERDLLKMERERRESNEDLRKNDEESQNLDRELQSLPGKVKQLQDQVNTLNNSVATLRASVDAKSAEIEPLRKNVASSTQTLNAANSRATQAKTGLDNANRAVGALDAQIAISQGKATAADQAVQSKVSEQNTAKTNLSAAQGDLSKLNDQKSALDTQIDGLAKEITSLQAQEKAAQGDLRVKTFRLQELLRTMPQSPEIPTLRTQIAQLQAQIPTLNQNIAAKNEAKKSATKTLADVGNRITSTNNAIAGYNTRLAALPGEIQAKTQERDAATAQTQQLQAQRPALAKAATDAQAELNEATKSQQLAQNAFNAASTALNAALPQLQQLQTQLNEATVSRDRIAKELTEAQARQQWANRRKGELGEQRGKILANLKDLEQRIPLLERQAQEQRRKVRELGERVNLLQARVNQLGNDLAQQQALLEGWINQQAQLGNRRSDLVNQNIAIQDQIESKFKSISRNETTIDRDRTTITQLKADLPGLRREVDQLQVALNVITDRTESAYAAWRPVDQEATANEADTLSKYNKYAEVQKTYDDRLAAARAAGTQQGEAEGRTAGLNAGTAEGTQQGNDKGAIAGKTQGLQAGLDRGIKAGDTQGYSDGVATGSQSAPDFNAGKQAGLKQGEADAFAFAHQSEFPKGRAAKRTELISQLPANSIKLDNKQLDGLVRRPESLKFNAFSVTFNEASIRNVDPDLERASVFTVAKFGTPNCDRGYVDFDSACKDAYRAAFSSSYDQGYKEAQPVAYGQAFEKARQLAFEQNKNVRYQEGFDQGYAVGNPRGLAEGARQANRRGFTEGQTQGYASNLERAKGIEFAKGGDDMVAYFASHSVLTFNEARAIRIGEDGSVGGDVVAGDNLNLVVKVVNFGSHNSDRGTIRFKWEAMTDNISVDNTVSDLIGIPAQTQAEVASVANAKVLPNADAGGQARLRVTAYLQDGTTQTRDIVLNITANVAAKILGIQWDETPKVGREEKMRVEVQNGSAFDAMSDMRVVLTTKESSSDVRITVANLNLKRLKAGEKQKVGDLRFICPNAEALKRGLIIRVTIYHGKNVAAFQELRAHD